MSNVHNSFTNLMAESLEVSVAAHTVIALRMARFATGHAESGHESRLMISEKIDAATEAAMAVAQSLMSGQPGLAPSRAMAVYNRRVRHNLDRLTQP